MLTDNTTQKTLIRIIMGTPYHCTKGQRWDQLIPFADYVILEACRVAGGCTVLEGDGFWIEGAELDKDLFDDKKLVEEKALILEIAVDSEKSARIIKHMKNAIIVACGLWKIDMDWVHITTSWIKTHHFSVAEDT